MKVRLIVLHIIFSIYLLVSTEAIQKTSEIERQRYGITYGKNASVQDFPYFCKIWIRRSGATYFCGGTIVNCNTVLTAAHCAFKANRLLVCFGSDQCRSTEQCFLIKDMKMVRLHKGFIEAIKIEQVYDDVAAIKVPGNFCAKTVKNAKVAKLCERKANQSCDVYTGIIGKTVGCGNTESGESAVTMKQADQLIASNHRGIDTFKSLDKFSSKYTLCFTLSPNNSKTSTCIGDSGSPLLLPNPKSKQMEVCGLVSFGSIDCTSGQPSAFTYLNKYLNFINFGTDGVSIDSIDLSEIMMDKALRNLGRQFNPSSDDIWNEFEKRHQNNELPKSQVKNIKGESQQRKSKSKGNFITFVNNCLNFVAKLLQTD